MLRCFLGKLLLVLVCSSAWNAAAQQAPPILPFLLADAQPEALSRQAAVETSSLAAKSPAKAFLFSILLPGAGQLYGRKKNGLIFGAIEAGVVTAYVVKHSQGKSQKKVTLAFADAHWDISRCADCLDPSIGTENLGDFGTQQYYEQIGKYDKFQAGWDDYSSSSSELSPNRKQYVGMRYTMNQAFKWASWSAGVVLFNHAVSAMHAALSVRAGNRAVRAKESRIRIGMDGFNTVGEWTPSAVLTVLF